MVGVRPSLKSVFPLSLVLGVLVEVLRNAIFPYHAVAMLFVHGVAQKYYFRIGWATSFAAVSLAFLLLNIGEAMTAIFVLPRLGSSLNEVLQSIAGQIVVGWVAQILLIVAAFGVRRRQWVLFALESRRGERSAAR